MSASKNGTEVVEPLTVETLDRKIASLKEQRKQVELNAVAAMNQLDGAVGLANQLRRELLGEDAQVQDEEDGELVDAVLHEEAVDESS